MPADPRKWVQVTEWLRARIETGELTPGTIVNIGLLADERDVSRPTIAHALKALEAAGLVRRYPGVGWQVEGPQEPESPV